MSFWNWTWVVDHLDLIRGRLFQHLWLTFIAVGVGFFISLPLALLAYQRRRLYAVVTWVTGILYTIPSLAAFALLLPFFGLSSLTAEIPLISYTLLILIRNVVTGLRGVDEDVKEAARGMGYANRQLLWRVELPLALPAIVAGVRIATVTTIGLVTVTALVGKGGLGSLMLGGFRNLFPEIAIVVGVTLSVALAVAADSLLLGTQRMVAPWARAARARTTP
jgi:osmoprotectant transport system permease protein